MNNVVEFTKLLIARREERDSLVANGATLEEIQAHNEQPHKLMEAQRNVVVIDEDLTESQLQELKFWEFVEKCRETATCRMNVRKPQEQVRLVIASMYPWMLDGLQGLCKAEADLTVLGVASDGDEAVQLARQLKPDILLLDLRWYKYPGKKHRTGMEVLRELNTPPNPAPVRVILLTDAIEKSQIVEALQLGARGVVLMDSKTEVLFKAIQTVMWGGCWVHRKQVSNVAQYLRTLMQSTIEQAICS